MLGRACLLATLLVVLGLAAPSLATPPDGPRPPVRYAWPVEGEVLQAFDPEAGAYGPGHRGVDLDAAPGTPVRAAAPGRVAHTGEVVGTVWVSIDHRDGVRTSYGPMADIRVADGQRVRRGAVLGRLAPGGHGAGGRDRGLHLGARRRESYLDPLVLLRGRASLHGPLRHEVGAPAARVPGPARAVAPRPVVSDAARAVAARLAVPGPPRPVDGAATQPLPSRDGPPSMVGLLHVPTIPHAR